jgi:hypothetical protein
MLAGLNSRSSRRRRCDAEIAKTGRIVNVDTPAQENANRPNPLARLIGSPRLLTRSVQSSRKERILRKLLADNAKVIVVAMVTAALTAAAPAVAHGVKHALFAHNADKVDGKHANQLRSIAEGRSYSFQDGSFQTVAATPTNVLEFQFNAPRKGFAQVEYSHTDFAQTSAQTMNSWLELDPATDCDQAAMVKPTEMFDFIAANTFAGSSGTAITRVSKGTHTLILCIVAGADGTQIGTASLIGTFVPAGQVSVAVPPAPIQKRSSFGR